MNVSDRRRAGVRGRRRELAIPLIGRFFDQRHPRALAPVQVERIYEPSGGRAVRRPLDVVAPVREAWKVCEAPARYLVAAPVASLAAPRAGPMDRA